MGQSFKKGKHEPDSRTNKPNKEIKNNDHYDDSKCKLSHSLTDGIMSVFCENNGKLEALVNGFVRDIEKLHLKLRTVPMEINKIILEFCKFDFKWSNSIVKHASAYTFFNDNDLKIQCTLDTEWNMLAMDYVLSLDESNNYEYFEWEMKVQDYPRSYVSWRFGFIEHPISDFKDWDSWIGQGSYEKNKHFLVHYFTDYNQFHVTDKKGTSLESGAKRLGFKKGDIVRLLVNVEKKDCSLSINGKRIGIVFTLLPGKLVPIIQCYYPMTLLCTKFGFV